jgi:hypothetical protein
MTWPPVAVVAQLALIAYLIVANHADLYPWISRGSLTLARLVRLGLVEGGRQVHGGDGGRP